MHADDARVNVNFWITNDSANTNTDNGGMIIWKKTPNDNASFRDFNSLESIDKIKDEVKDTDFARILKEVDLANYINSRENGVSALLEERGETLPVGIRKRMSLARAMVKSYQLIVFDEPTEGLDKIGREKVINLIILDLRTNLLLTIS